jgi:hypothetical protein
MMSVFRAAKSLFCKRASVPIPKFASLRGTAL